MAKHKTHKTDKTYITKGARAKVKARTARRLSKALGVPSDLALALAR